MLSELIADKIVYIVDKDMYIILYTMHIANMYKKMYSIFIRKQIETVKQSHKINIPQTALKRKDGFIMCITTAEMNQKMEKRKSLQMQLKKMEDDIKALDMDIIEYLMDNLNDCLTTNSKGKEILQFIGNMCKATYSPQERETVDKEEVKKLLNDKDYQKVRKVSYYSVLRVS